MMGDERGILRWSFLIRPLSGGSIGEQKDIGG
jgi:hypothetical protein